MRWDGMKGMAIEALSLKGRGMKWQGCLIIPDLCCRNTIPP